MRSHIGDGDGSDTTATPSACSPIWLRSIEADMALTQIDLGIRYPYPTFGGDTYYYWTSVYYADSDDFTSLANMAFAVRSVAREGLTNYCSLQLSNLKQPPGRGNIVYVHHNNFTAGSVISDGSYAILIQVGMVDFFDADGNRFRKYYRQPLRRVDVDGDMLSSTGIANITHYADTVMADGRFRTLHGGLLDNYTVSPRIHKWQLRHGTKRRLERLLEQEI